MISAIFRNDLNVPPLKTIDDATCKLHKNTLFINGWEYHVEICLLVHNNLTHKAVPFVNILVIIADSGQTRQRCKRGSRQEKKTIYFIPLCSSSTA